MKYVITEYVKMDSVWDLTASVVETNYELRKELKFIDDNRDIMRLVSVVCVWD